MHRKIFCDMGSNMRKRHRSVKELIDAAGGEDHVSAALGGRPTSYAVLKWRYNGIPDRYWPILLPLANATAEEMLAANISARTIGAAP